MGLFVLVGCSNIRSCTLVETTASLRASVEVAIRSFMFWLSVQLRSNVDWEVTYSAAGVELIHVLAIALVNEILFCFYFVCVKLNLFLWDYLNIFKFQGKFNFTNILLLYLRCFFCYFTLIHLSYYLILRCDSLTFIFPELGALEQITSLTFNVVHKNRELYILYNYCFIQLHFEMSRYEMLSNSSHNFSTKYSCSSGLHIKILFSFCFYYY